MELGEEEWPAGEVDQGPTRAPPAWLSAVRVSTHWGKSAPPALSLSLDSPRRHRAFPGFLPWSERTHFGRRVSAGSAGGPGVGRCFSELRPSRPPHSLPAAQASIRKTRPCCCRVWAAPGGSSALSLLGPLWLRCRVGVVQAFPITGRRRLSNSPRGVVYKCSVSSWDRAPWD